MKFITALILTLTLIAPAFACEPISNCDLGDALIQFGEESFLAECIRYNSSHDKWEFTKDGKDFLISTENSKVWSMDGELKKEVKNGKVIIRAVPTYSFYIVRKDMSEPPVGVDEISVSKDLIAAYTINTRGDRMKAIYPTSEYEAITSYGIKIKP